MRHALLLDDHHGVITLHHLQRGTHDPQPCRWWEATQHAALCCSLRLAIEGTGTCDLSAILGDVVPALGSATGFCFTTGSCRHCTRELQDVPASNDPFVGWLRGYIGPPCWYSEYAPDGLRDVESSPPRACRHCSRHSCSTKTVQLASCSMCLSSLVHADPATRCTAQIAASASQTVAPGEPH
jgi:hypothetical protein